MISDVLIVLGLALLIGGAVWRVIRKARKGGGCCGDKAEAEARLQVSDRNKAHYPHEITVRVGGMTCENCAVKVENALNELEGVWAKVDIGTHRAKIRCKNPPDEQKIKQAIVRAGYIPM